MANDWESRAEFNLYIDAEGKWRWRLVAGNGKIVADSAESYASLRNVRRAVETVTFLAGVAVVTKEA